MQELVELEAKLKEAVEVKKRNSFGTGNSGKKKSSGSYMDNNLNENSPEKNEKITSVVGSTSGPSGNTASLKWQADMINRHLLGSELSKK